MNNYIVDINIFSNKHTQCLPYTVEALNKIDAMNVAKRTAKSENPDMLFCSVYHCQYVGKTIDILQQLTGPMGRIIV